MKYSLGISNFLEEMFSLSHSVVFLYYFALITEEGFLISPCSWNFAFRWGLNNLGVLQRLSFMLTFLTNWQTFPMWLNWFTFLPERYEFHFSVFTSFLADALNLFRLARNILFMGLS